MKKYLITAAALVLLATTAQAANIQIERDGCDPAGCYVIHITGKIALDDFKKFHDVVEKNQIKNAVVYLNSDGGNLLGGLLTGLEIHERKFFTFVPPDAYCASVCASMWLAGKKRYAEPSSHIGFHQPYAKNRRGRVSRDPQTIALVKQYYAEIGIPKPAADFMVAADPKDIYWLNGDLANGFGIEWTETSEKKPSEEKTVTLPKSFVDSLTAKDKM